MAGQRVAGRRDALYCMLVTELTSQLDRSELKEEASRNTAREESVVRQRQRAHKQGQRGDRTAVHVGDAAHIPPREVLVEVRALVEHCQHPGKSDARVRQIAGRDARPQLHLFPVPPVQLLKLVTALTSQSSIRP